VAPNRLFISGLSTLSALGVSGPEVVASIESMKPHPSSAHGVPVFSVTTAAEKIVAMTARNPRFTKLDRVTLLALGAVAMMLERHALDISDLCGVSIGSSRGPTASLEVTHAQYLDSSVVEATARVPVETSPTTTAGNISAWVAQLLMEYSENCKPITSPNVSLRTSPFCCSTSMTCTSAFHSLLVGVAFLRAGMVRSWVFGGSEAPLTGYTIAQMSALRIYSRNLSPAWPCQPLAAGERRESTLVLGEGAGVAVLRQGAEPLNPHDDLELLSIGWSMEKIPSATGVSDDGIAFESAMRQALSGLGQDTRIDAAIMHAAGTSKGDAAERAAVQRVFSGAAEQPALLTTKPLTGHTFAASGMLSLELARAVLRGTRWPGVGYPSWTAAPGLVLASLPSAVASQRGQEEKQCPQRVKILINTAGFGGNVIALVVCRSG
jgi:3-oxoacyl-[acyl-carrier-protein] synthase II